MEHSESIVNIAEAFVALQAEIKDPKLDADRDYITKTGKKIKFKYASLPEILKTVRPVLSKHGIALLQEPKTVENVVQITTTLIHKSGEWVRFEPLVMKAASPYAQEIGSAITYGRRYNISSVLGLGAEDDDDGNAAQDGIKDNVEKNEHPKKESPKKEASKEEYAYATPEQVAEIKDLIVKANVAVGSILSRYRVANVESLSAVQANSCIGILKKQVGE